VAETTNLLGLVKGISSHLHSAHGDHLCVHVNHFLLGELQLQRRLLKVIDLEGRFREGDLDLLRSISSRSEKAGSSGREGALMIIRQSKQGQYDNNLQDGTVDINKQRLNIRQERMPWGQLGR
jgi:hypothetical protein